MPEYTLADLTRLTGAKRRSVQLWAEAGVLTAEADSDRAGTGTHRRFSRNEAVIAIITTALAQLHLPIGDLLKVSGAVRSVFNGQGDGQPWWEDVERCIQGELDMNLVIANSSRDARITPFTHPKEEKPEKKWLRIGETISQIEQEPDGVGLLIPLAKRLRNLR